MNIIIFLILGFLTSLLFPPYFFFPLGFIIFPILCIYIEKKFSKSQLKLIFINIFSFGFTFFGSLLFWMKNPFFIFEETKNYFFLTIFLIILFALIFTIIFLLILSLRNYFPIILIIPFIFIFTEYFISIFFYGFPWITFSLIISSNDYLLLFIKNYGTFITSYLVVQIFCLPYLFIFTKSFKNNIKFILYFLFFPIILGVFINMVSNQKNIILNKKINIEIFQLNFKNTANESELQNRLDIIIDNIKNSNSELLIFAENNYPYLIKNFLLNAIQYNIKKNQTVVIGGTRLDKKNYYNSLFNISSSNISYYDKKILVPFGEFLPLRNLLSFMTPITGPSDYSKGNNLRLIHINNNLSYIPIICYEIIYYWKLINNVNYKSNFIVNITNDIWFGKYLGPYQHFYLSKLRAAEFNKPLIRVSNNGISGIIDHNGQILSKINLNNIENKKYKLSINDRKNFYKTHNILKLYFITFFVLFILYKFIKRNEHK